MGSGRKLRPPNTRGEPPGANQFSVAPILMMLDPKDSIATRIPPEIVEN